MTISDTQLHALDGVLDDHYGRADSRTDAGFLSRVVGSVTHAADPADLDTLASDLFAVVDALSSSVALRRAVTDPGAQPGQRQGLVHGLLDGKVSRTAVNVVVDAAGMRWSSGQTLVAALERQAVRAQLLTADRAGMLDETEDELFRFARTAESDPELRNALSDRAMPLSARQDLVGDLLNGRAGVATVALARRAVVARERTFAHTIEGYVDLAAAQKNRVVATVRVARPLDADQRRRLQAALARQVGRDLVLQEVVDPDVLGGVRVELGDEVVEGTVAARLDEAQRLFGPA
ncbi:MAG: F0F1 ATP synthase subunit delta [Janthinobacterium lividum]